MITIKKAIQELSDAILATGKPLEHIGKGPIFEFLKKSGVNQENFNEIWNKLKELHKPSGVSGQSGHLGTSGPGNYQSIQNDRAFEVPQEKVREPRKNVFGTIKKIAG